MKQCVKSQNSIPHDISLSHDFVLESYCVLHTHTESRGFLNMEGGMWNEGGERTKTIIIICGSLRDNLFMFSRFVVVVIKTSRDQCAGRDQTLPPYCLLYIMMKTSL